MKAIILSAGMGTRVGDQTSRKPKCLLDIHGTPLSKLTDKDFVFLWSQAGQSSFT